MKKYSVLICDDEPLVCDLICNLVDWKQLGCEIIQVVHDGKTALQIIEEREPDIVITDIRMPVINGLELIRRAKETGKRSVFVVVSGYKSFEYAYEAINYGVSNYLLKPIQKTELENIVTRIVGEKEQSAQLQSQVRDYQSVLREQFIYMLARGDMNDLSMDYLNHTFNLNLREGKLRFMLVSLDSRDAGAINGTGSARLELVTTMAGNIICSQFEEYCCCFLVKLGQGQIVLLLNYNEPEKFNRSFSTKLVKRCREQLNTTEYYFTAALGMEVDDSTSLYEAFTTARTALRTRLSGRYNQLIFYEKEEENCPLEHIISKECWNDFYQGLELLDVNSIDDFMSRYCRLLNDAVPKYPLAVYNGLALLLERFEDRCKKLGILQEDTGKRFRMDDWRFAQGDARSLERMIGTYITGAVVSHRQQRENADTIPIEKAKEYISMHLGDALSLDLVAEYVRLNPIYLSALFKKSTGTNFLSYVTEARIEKAKELLLETESQIAEIAGKIGYFDVKYFSKTFRKITGITPQQYRKLHGR